MTTPPETMLSPVYATAVHLSSANERICWGASHQLLCWHQLDKCWAESQTLSFPNNIGPCSYAQQHSRKSRMCDVSTDLASAHIWSDAWPQLTERVPLPTEFCSHSFNNQTMMSVYQGSSCEGFFPQRKKIERRPQQNIAIRNQALRHPISNPLDIRLV